MPQSQLPSNDPVPAIDYGRGEPPVAASTVFGGVSGFVAAIIAVPVWCLAIYLSIDAFFVPTRDGSATLFQAGVVIAVASTCSGAAICWIGELFRRKQPGDWPPGG